MLAVVQVIVLEDRLYTVGGQTVLNGASESQSPSPAEFLAWAEYSYVVQTVRPEIAAEKDWPVRTEPAQSVYM
jgi:hypothetical protein